MIKSLPMASDEIRFYSESPLRREHRVGVKLARPKIQPGEIGDAGPIGIHQPQVCWRERWPLYGNCL